MRRLVLLLCFASLLVAPPLAAQMKENYERGFAPEQLYEFTDLDHVNLFNGNLIITIPIGSKYPLNGGSSYELTLVYNSQIWEINEVTPIAETNPPCCEPWAFPTRRSNAGLGWTLSLGRVIDVYTPQNTTDGFAYESPDGNDHRFTINRTTTTGQPVVTTDGSYLRWDPVAQALSAPDGTVRLFWPSGTLRRMTDPYGNFVNVEEQFVSGKLTAWHITDSVGRSHWVRFKTFSGTTFIPGTAQNNYKTVVDQVELQTSAGTAIYRFVYANEAGVTDLPSTISESCFGGAQGWPHEYALPLLRKVELPNGSAYSDFAYVTTDQPVSSCEQGMITSLRLPTRGKVEWQHGYYTYPREGCNDAAAWTTSTVGVRQRRLASGNGLDLGTWTYDQGMWSVDNYNCGQGTFTDISQEVRTTVTSPSGRKDVYHFSAWPATDPSSAGISRFEYGHPQIRLFKDSTNTRYLSAETFDCSSGACPATPNRTRYVRYVTKGTVQDAVTRAITSVGFEGDKLPRIESERIVYDDGTFADLNRSDFDGFGHYRREETGGNFTGSNTRIAFTNFNPGTDANGHRNGSYAFTASDKWVLNTFDEQWTSENGHTAKTEACFEAATGFLRRRRVLKNDGATVAGISQSGEDLVGVFTRDAQGNTVKEEYFGGDSRPNTTTVATGALCSIALSAPEYELQHEYQNGVRRRSRYYNGAMPMPFFNQDLDIDLSGIVLASRDTTGRTTTYVYDTSNRLTTITPPESTATTAVYTSATTTTPPRLTVTRGDVVDTYEYDDLGRLTTQTGQRPGAGQVRRMTQYDLQGRRQAVSEWDTQSPPRFFTTFTYDAFDRLLTQRPPEGAAHDVIYSYEGVHRLTRTLSVATSATEEQVTNRYTFDRHGRLVIVEEAVGPDQVTATYGYDVGNRLANVTIPSAEGTQTRTFTYDNRGFLRTETHPERGPGSVTNSDYDARGHAHRRIAGPFDITLTTDKAERLITTTETSSGRKLSEFSYDDPQGLVVASCSRGQCNGKLAAAARYNYPPDLGTVIVTDAYQYGGIDGQLSRRDQAVSSTADFAGESFRVAQTFTSLGQLDTLAYPCRTQSDGTCKPGERPLTLDYNYTNGQLTGITGWATLTYQASGLISTVTHGTGATAVRESWSADPFLAPRARQITATGPNNSIFWESGTYVYDGAGNIKNIGTSAYVYDRLGRLSGWSTTPGLWLGRIYDTFGNYRADSVYRCVTTSTGVGCASSSTLLRTMRGTTNQYADVTYDGAGNVLTDRTRTFAYDGLGVVNASTVDGKIFRYIYDALDERIAVVERRTGNDSIPRNRTTWTLRSPDHQLLRVYLDDSTSGTRVFSWREDQIWRGKLLVANDSATAGVRHYSLDHLGSPRAITGASGQLLGLQQFGPFGDGGTSDGGVLQFASNESDANVVADAALDAPDYLHARYYDRRGGRFLSLDPALDQRALAEPQRWNQYAYCRNNPLNRVDPDGRADLKSEVASTVFGFLPIAGEFQDATIAFTGYDPITSERQPGWVRVVSGVAIVLPLIGGKWIAQAAGAVPHAGPGVRKVVTEAMSPRAAAYQAQIVGAAHAGSVYVVDGVKFDGYDEAAGVLLEAKGEGYAKFVDKATGAFKAWFRGAQELVGQARRQIQAANGTPIVWHVAEERAVEAIRKVLKENNITEIKVVYDPPKPRT